MYIIYVIYKLYFNNSRKNMFKKTLLSIFIIFIMKTILFSQDTCENLNQDECIETLFCNCELL